MDDALQSEICAQSVVTHPLRNTPAVIRLLYWSVRRAYIYARRYSPTVSQNKSDVYLKCKVRDKNVLFPVRMRWVGHRQNPPCDVTPYDKTPP